MADGDGLVERVRSAAELADREGAAANIAGHLIAGELVMLLGSGVSKGLGLPDWTELVERCEAALPSLVPDLDAPLMRRMDAVSRACGNSESYVDLVSKALYSDVEAGPELELALLRNPMLIALGAMAMSSARGSVAEVLTLNFDDVLDWYLKLHGYRTQVVGALPALIGSDSDVRIFHVHGLLPRLADGRRSLRLVLGHDEFIDRIRDFNGPWATMIGALFQSKVVLAVGTSMNDIDFDVQFRRAQSIIAGVRPTGYVLGKGIGEAQREALLSWGLVPVSFDDYNDIPEFLLGVCQRAAEGDSVDLDAG